MEPRKMVMTMISFIVVIYPSLGCVPITLPTFPIIPTSAPVTSAPVTNAPVTNAPITTAFESTENSDSSTDTTVTTAVTTTITTTTTTPCPISCGTWTTEGDKCFQLFTNAISWTESQTSCEGKGGHLASIDSQAEQDAVFGLTNGADTWIGGNDIVSNQVWIWSADSAPLDAYSNWFTNRPKNNENQDCVKMKITGTWDNVVCSKSLQYVCERPPTSSCAPTTAPTTETPTTTPTPTTTTTTISTTTTITTTTLSPTCGPWEQVGSKCFQLCDRPSEWDLSQTVCESKGGNLAAPESQAEQDKVVALSNGVDTWIGGNDVASNQDWVWSSSAAFTYTAWFTKRPKDNENQDCVKLRTTGLWDNVVCSKELQFVCEKTCSSATDEIVTRVQGYIDAGSCGAISCNGNEGTSAESYYNEFTYNGKRVIISSQVPDHDAENDAISPNPNTRCERWQFVELPMDPSKSSTSTATGLSTVGYAVTGGVFFNHWSSPNGDLAMTNEGPSLDSCNGHSAPEGAYHYHANIDCTSAGAATGANDPDTCLHIGYYIDGVPIYGLCKDSSGKQMTSCYSLNSGVTTTSVTTAGGTYSPIGSVDSDYSYDSAAFTAGDCNLDDASGAIHPTTGKYSYFTTTGYPWVPILYYGDQGTATDCSAA